MSDLKKQVQLILSAKDGASKTLRTVSGRFNELERAGRALMNVLGPLAGAFAVKEIIDAKVAWEGYENALKTVTGSQQAANEEIAFVRALSAKLGLDLKSSIDAYTQLSASAKGTGLSLEDTRHIFAAVSSAATVLGLSADDSRGALTALSQMLSKGKVSAEELRGQLGERLPGAFNLFAKSMGVSTSELDKMLQQGQVIAKDTLPAFADALLNAYGPGVEDAANSTRAAINRFNNELLALKLELADSGVIDAFTAALDGVSQILEDADFKAAIADLGTSFKDLMDSAGGAEQFIGGLVKVFETLALGVQTALVPIRVLGEGLGAVSAAIWQAVNGDFRGAMAILKAYNPLDELEEGFLNLQPTIDRFLGDSKKVVDKTQQQGEAAAEAATKVKELSAEQKKNAETTAAAAKAADDDAKAKKEQAAAAQKAAEQAAKLSVEMEKIASSERIKTLEITADFNAEQLKAQVERAKAIIDTVNTSIESTGGLLGSLFDDLSQADGFGDKWAIEKQIKDENRRREEAMAQQKKLTDVETELAKEKLRRLKAGDALVKITGDGLEPELEAFMWKILERIQMRVNEEQSEFLIGI